MNNFNYGNYNFTKRERDLSESNMQRNAEANKRDRDVRDSSFNPLNAGIAAAIAFFSGGTSLPYQLGAAATAAALAPRGEQFDPLKSGVSGFGAGQAIGADLPALMGSGDLLSKANSLQSAYGNLTDPGTQLQSTISRLTADKTREIDALKSIIGSDNATPEQIKDAGKKYLALTSQNTPPNQPAGFPSSPMVNAGATSANNQGLKSFQEFTDPPKLESPLPEMPTLGPSPEMKYPGLSVMRNTNQEQNGLPYKEIQSKMMNLPQTNIPDLANKPQIGPVTDQIPLTSQQPVTDRQLEAPTENLPLDTSNMSKNQLARLKDEIALKTQELSNKTTLDAKTENLNTIKADKLSLKSSAGYLSKAIKLTSKLGNNLNKLYSASDSLNALLSEVEQDANLPTGTKGYIKVLDNIKQKQSEINNSIARIESTREQREISANNASTLRDVAAENRLANRDYRSQQDQQKNEDRKEAKKVAMRSSPQYLTAIDGINATNEAISIYNNNPSILKPTNVFSSRTGRKEAGQFRKAILNSIDLLSRSRSGMNVTPKEQALIDEFSNPKFYNDKKNVIASLKRLQSTFSTRLNQIENSSYQAVIPLEINEGAKEAPAKKPAESINPYPKGDNSSLIKKMEAFREEGKQ